MPTIQEVQKRLQELNRKGYVPSLRTGATGVGYTFEYHFGLGETNIQIPDLGGRIELKAARKQSNSMITLFTFNRGVWKLKQIDVIRKFGYVSDDGREALYCSLWANTPNQLGFTVNLDRNGNILSLMHNDIEIATWSIYRLVGALLYKLGKILLVLAESRKSSGAKEEFHFNEAYLLDKPSEKKFVDAIANSRVCLDIRMHINEKGNVRNHGTGFRVMEKDLSLFYSKITRLL